MTSQQTQEAAMVTCTRLKQDPASQYSSPEQERVYEPIMNLYI